MRLVSANPLGLADERLPPCFLGLSVHDDPESWEKAAQVHNKEAEQVKRKLDNWFGSANLELEPGHFFGFASPYLNLYTYPKQVDYFNDEIRPRNGHWLRMSHCIQPNSSNGHDSLVLPAEFESLPGKLIYLGMGTIVCQSISLMSRIIDQLKECPHRILVSMGPSFGKIKLPSNMHGASFLPQLEV